MKVRLLSTRLESTRRDPHSVFRCPTGLPECSGVLVTVALALSLAGCSSPTPLLEVDDDDGEMPTTGDVDPPSTVEGRLYVEPAVLDLEVNGVGQFTATVELFGACSPTCAVEVIGSSPSVTVADEGGGSGMPVPVTPVSGDSPSMFSHTFTVSCNAPVNSELSVFLDDGTENLDTSSVAVSCASPSTTTTGPTTDTNDTNDTDDTDDTDDTNDTNDPPTSPASLFCFDKFGDNITRVELGAAPAATAAPWFANLTIGAPAKTRPPQFAAGLFPAKEGDDPIERGLYLFVDWSVEEPEASEAFIPHPAPNQFDAMCPSSAGVLLTGDTTDSLVCDFATETCDEVVAPVPLVGCHCIADNCIASGTDPGILRSTDGGRTFVLQDNSFDAFQIFGDLESTMVFTDSSTDTMQVTTDGGSSYSAAALPAEFSTAHPLLVLPGQIIAGVPFVPGDLIVSTDNGATWDIQPFSETDVPVQVVETTDGEVVALTEGGDIFLHSDGGSWENVPGVSVGFNQVCFGG